ncbi:MAG: DUF4296 domain-containing protein [Saprospiraceae bacterium]
MRIIFQWVLVFALFVDVSSCTKEATPYQLTDEKLTNIITDIHISESATQHLSLSLRDSMVQVYLDQILEINEVSKAVFEPEYQQLKRDPKKLQLIYGKVIERLNKLKIKRKDTKKETPSAKKNKKPLPKKKVGPKKSKVF